MKKNSRLTNLFFILALTTIITVCLSIARYRSTIAGDVKVIVGAPIITSNAEEIIINEMTPNTAKTYSFYVSNTNNENQISDAEMNYKIHIETTRNLPLVFTVTDINGKVININQEEFTLPAGVSQKNTYILTVTWDTSEGALDYRFADEIDYININIESYQKGE